MIKKVAFTLYPVKDTARARAFYEGTLGLKRGLSEGSGMWTEYDLPGGGCLALFNNGQGEPSSAGGTLAFEVEDLDAFVQDLKAKGVTFKGDMVHSPVCRMAFIEDSEGNDIILHKLKREEG